MWRTLVALENIRAKLPNSENPPDTQKHSGTETRPEVAQGILRQTWSEEALARSRKPRAPKNTIPCGAIFGNAGTESMTLRKT